DRSRVVGQSADDEVIEFHIIAQTAAGEVGKNRGQILGRLGLLDERRDILARKTERAKLVLALLFVFALQFVDGLVKIVGLGRIAATALIKFLPRISAAEANHEIIRRETKRAQRVDQQRNEFRVRGRV